MAYTRHGHHIRGTVLDLPRPLSVARCGGPGLCPQCSIDAGKIHPTGKPIPPKLVKMEHMDPQLKAKLLIAEYYNSKVEKSGDLLITTDDVYIVWFSKTLQNWKAMLIVLITTVPDGMYYEVTHNGDKKETYIDAYKKFDNVCIADQEDE